jgi:hypothetical protein
VIARPPRTIPVPQAILDAFPAPPSTPAEQARLAGVMLAAQAQLCEDPDAREEGRHRMAALIARANKQLARTGAVYGWGDMPGLNR